MPPFFCAKRRRLWILIYLKFEMVWKIAVIIK
jgi:hypothetical protein